MGDGAAHTAGQGIAASEDGDFRIEFLLLILHHVDAVGDQEGTQFLETHHVVHFGYVVTLVAFGQTRADEYHLHVGIGGLHAAGGIDHRAARVRDERLEHRSVLVHPAHIGGAAGAGHEGLALGDALLQLFGLVARGILGTQSHLHHVVEADLLDGGEDGGRRGVELAVDGRCHDGRDLLVGVGQALVHVNDLGTLHDGAVGACLHALAAVDALVLVDVLRAVGLFGDGLHGAGLLAGNGRVDDGVVGAHLLAQTAAYAVLLGDLRLAALEGDGALGAVHHTGTRLAAAAHVGDEILRLHAGAARLVYDREDVLLRILVVERALGIVRQGNQVDVLLVVHVEAEDGDDLVAQDVAILVNAAADVFLVAGTHLDGHVFDAIDEVVVLQQFDQADQQLTLREHRIVVIQHCCTVLLLGFE